MKYRDVKNVIFDKTTAVWDFESESKGGGKRRRKRRKRKVGYLSAFGRCRRHLFGAGGGGVARGFLHCDGYTSTHASVTFFCLDGPVTSGFNRYTAAAQRSAVGRYRCVCTSAPHNTTHTHIYTGFLQR